MHFEITSNITFTTLAGMLHFPYYYSTVWFCMYVKTVVWLNQCVTPWNSTAQRTVRTWGWGHRSHWTLWDSWEHDKCSPHPAGDKYLNLLPFSVVFWSSLYARRPERYWGGRETGPVITIHYGASLNLSCQTVHTHPSHLSATPTLETVLYIIVLHYQLYDYHVLDTQEEVYQMVHNTATNKQNPLPCMFKNRR